MRNALSQISAQRPQARGPAALASHNFTFVTVWRCSRRPADTTEEKARGRHLRVDLDDHRGENAARAKAMFVAVVVKEPAVARTEGIFIELRGGTMLRLPAMAVAQVVALVRVIEGAS